MKEYLRKNQDGVYVLELSCDQEAQEQHNNNWIEVPDGAEKLLFSKINNNHKHFVSSDNKLMSVEDIMNGDGYWYGNAQEYICSISPDIIWQRPQQPEDLPFINDKPKSINDQYAEIEQVRQKHSHYFKDVSNLNHIDVYDVLKLFNVTDPCLQHIVKKALCAGNRGHKDLATDLQNIVDTAIRAVELNK